MNNSTLRLVRNRFADILTLVILIGLVTFLYTNHTTLNLPFFILFALYAFSTVFFVLGMCCVLLFFARRTQKYTEQLSQLSTQERSRGNPRILILGIGTLALALLLFLLTQRVIPG